MQDLQPMKTGTLSDINQVEKETPKKTALSLRQGRFFTSVPMDSEQLAALVGSNAHA